MAAEEEAEEEEEVLKDSLEDVATKSRAETVDVVYDKQLDCYYEPATNTYYEKKP